MGKRPEISVIVPVYNVSRYLSRCIESLRSQTFQSFELLLIDDGSTDGSAALADEWAGLDARIRVFHQANAGVSAARNRGLEEAAGRFICFVDADDWVYPSYLEALYTALPAGEEEGLVIQGFKEVSPDGITSGPGVSLSDKCWRKAEFGWLFREEAISNLGYSCAKLYARSLLDRHPIRFRVGIHCCEDLLFMLEYLLYGNYVVFGAARYYVYVKYPDSLSRTVNSFSSEYNCFTVYYSLIRKIEAHFGLMPADIPSVYASLMICFRRALKTDYLPVRGVPPAVRRAHVRQLLQEAGPALLDFYRPVYKTDQVGKFFLLHRWIVLYDAWVSSLFRLGVKAIFMGGNRIKAAT